MAYDEELAERVRDLVIAEQPVEQKMFGGIAFLIGGHMAVSVSGQGGLLLRVPPERTGELLEQPGAAEFTMGNRPPMAGWLRVSPDVLDARTLKRWVKIGIDHAKSLPPKAGPKKAVAKKAVAKKAVAKKAVAKKAVAKKAVAKKAVAKKAVAKKAARR
jgi:hypothetical protein